MAKKRLSADLLSLQRAQLDSKLGQDTRLRAIQAPGRGWIRAIRVALGMTAAQLGNRLGISPQAVFDLERREVAETITVASLRKAAEALNCDVVVALVPKTSLEQTVHDQARVRAESDRGRIMHTMRLEAQDEGVAATLDRRERIDSWLTTRINRLWD